MNIYYLIAATISVACFFCSHFIALRHCVLADWWRVLFAFLGFCSAMLIVGTVPMFDMDTIRNSQDYLSLFFRSAIEETSKIIACYIVFEMLNRQRLKFSTLAFCSLVAFYESAIPLASIITVLTEGFISLESHNLPAYLNNFDKMERSLRIGELPLFIFSEILRIFIHFHLTYSGICFLMLDRGKFLFFMPLLTHGILNQFILYTHATIESNSISILLKSVSILIAIAILVILLRKKIREDEFETKQTIVA